MLRFAPRYGIVSPCLVRASRLGPRRAVNDNGSLWGAKDWQGEDAHLAEALRLFAAHGLSAARRACDAAAQAKSGGDDAKARYWLGVCRTLDRRMALDFQRRMARRG